MALCDARPMAAGIVSANGQRSIFEFIGLGVAVLALILGMVAIVKGIT